MDAAAETAREIVEQIAAEAAAADGADPLDEAARIALADGAASVIVEDDAFALLHDGDLSLVVRPAARGRGLGSALLTRAESSYDTGLTAWSHGNHPAAARLAASHGWERVRDLWVMRRPTSLPLPALEVPAGTTIRPYRDADAAGVVAVYSRLGFGHAAADTHVQYRRG
jgi:mycothiol synthase